MLKVRIIPTLLFKDFGLVKGVRFDSWRRVGTVMQTVKVYNLREVDELVFVDIRATNENREPDFATIDEIADECFMPLSVGGGVRTVEHVRKLLQVGADKVVLGTVAVENPDLVSEISHRFGAQCAVVAIDVKKSEAGKYSVFTHSGKQDTGLLPVEFAQKMEQMGAGEILLTSIDQDGTMQGYDLELIKQITEAVRIPVIASGGAGNYEHLSEAVLIGGASGVGAASIFHFTEQTPREAKVYLKEKGIPVRL